MNKINITKLTTLTGHKDCIYTVEKSKDPAVLFSGAGDGLVVKWDLQEPENGRLMAKLDSSVYALHYSEFNNLLLIGQNFDGLHMVDIAVNKNIGSLNLTTAAIFDIKSYGNKAFIGTGEGIVIVVDLETLSVVKRIKASAKSARSIAINPVENEFAVGFSDNVIRIFDLQSYEIKQICEGHTNSVFTVRYTPDFSCLLSAGRDANLKIWKAGTQYELLDSIVAHMYAINHIEYSPDSKYFVTCSMDKSIKVWDASAYQLLKVIDKARHAGHGTSVNKLCWTTYNNLLVSGSDDRTLSVWDIEID